MKWIQAAGANASVEYKENGGGTHLPSVPEIHFKLEIKEQKKKNVKHIFGSSEADSRSQRVRVSRSGPVGAAFMVWVEKAEGEDG